MFHGIDKKSEVTKHREVLILAFQEHVLVRLSIVKPRAQKVIDRLLFQRLKKRTVLWSKF